MSDQTTTVPPSPCSVAEASSRAPEATTTAFAELIRGSWPCHPPPTSTSPPPAGPLAYSPAAEPTKTLSPVMRISPPRVPASTPLASNWPLTVTTPRSPPCNRMRPFWLTRLWAVTSPDCWITLSKMALALRAESTTTPPSARMTCWFDTSAFMTAASTTTERRREPANCRVTASPAAMATVPSRAKTTPSLRTSGASRAMYPPSSACSRPAFSTRAPAVPPVKCQRPDRKSSLLRL